MVQAILSLRFLMLTASAGTILGGTLMFWLGAAKLFGAVSSAFASSPVPTKSIISAVMGATDAFLFGVVLFIFAYAIAFGFVIPRRSAIKAQVPRWMMVDSVGELKSLLVEVVLVYLIVDFVTDLAEQESHSSWQILVMPIAILLVAGAFRLLGAASKEHPTTTD